MTTALLPIVALQIASAPFKLVSFFHKYWPPVLIGFGLIARSMWTGFLGYVIFLVVWRA